MTAKFDAFREALEALCIEHGVRLKDAWNDWGHESETFVSLEEATEEVPAGLDLEIRCVTPLTAKEKAEAAERRAKWEAEAAKREEAYLKQQAEWRAQQEKDLAERMQSPEYLKQRAIIDAYAAEQRKKNMRVTRIPGDFHDIGDRPCRVWCNEQEITDWTVADDFRRVVETPGGVHHGAVRIDLGPVMEYFDVELPAKVPGHVKWSKDLEVFDLADKSAGTQICDEVVPLAGVVRIWADKSQVYEAPAAKQKHIPARKRKAGK